MGRLSCTQHSTVTARCPATHAVEGHEEQGVFTSRASRFCYHSRESWEIPRQRPQRCFGVSTSPEAGGEGPSRGSVQPCTEHPRLQLPPRQHPSCCPEAPASGQGGHKKVSGGAVGCQPGSPMPQARPVGTSGLLLPRGQAPLSRDRYKTQGDGFHPRVQHLRQPQQFGLRSRWLQEHQGSLQPSAGR